MKAPLKFQTGLSRQTPASSILPDTTAVPYIKRNQKFSRKICIMPHFVIASPSVAGRGNLVYLPVSERLLRSARNDIIDIMQTSQIIKK